MRQELTQEEREVLSPQLNKIQKEIIRQINSDRFSTKPVPEGVYMNVVRISKWGIEMQILDKPNGLCTWGRFRFNCKTGEMKRMA